MPHQFPLPLLIAWAFFFASAVGQFHYEQIIRRSGVMQGGLLRAIEISQLLWICAAIAVLVYYIVAASWYWSIVLAVGGSILGALVAGLLFSVVGEMVVSMCGFIVWPVAAAFAVFTIHGMPS